jgi:hypothetical protein
VSPRKRLYGEVVPLATAELGMSDHAFTLKAGLSSARKVLDARSATDRHRMTTSRSAPVRGRSIRIEKPVGSWSSRT